jgi:hypothetical protein
MRGLKVMGQCSNHHGTEKESYTERLISLESK